MRRSHSSRKSFAGVLGSTSNHSALLLIGLMMEVSRSDHLPSRIEPPQRSTAVHRYPISKCSGLLSTVVVPLNQAKGKDPSFFAASRLGRRAATPPNSFFGYES